ncbi:MAG: VanZ family protein [Saonia sp.]
MVFITVFSLFSFPDDTLAIDIEIPHLDKVVHFIFYFMVVILGSLFLWETRRDRLRLVNAVLIALCFAIFYGIIIEVIQSKFTVKREGDLWDIVANSIGALTGTIVIKFIFSEKRRLKWKN